MCTLTDVLFAGIDLAWSRKYPSGVVLLDGNTLVDWRADLVGDREILDFIAHWTTPGSAVVVAVDAPLCVPNVQGARECDRALSAAWGRYRAGAHPANRTRLAFDGDVRGETLVAMLVEEAGFELLAPVVPRPGARVVCEVYPHPAHVSLFGLEERLKYKAKPGWGLEARWTAFGAYQRHLAGLAQADPALLGAAELLATEVTGLRGRQLKAWEDTLDALTCAYVAAYSWRHGPAGQIVYGDGAGGHILVPRRPVMDYAGGSA